jgi:hypothetical protein
MLIEFASGVLIVLFELAMVFLFCIGPPDWMATLGPPLIPGERLANWGTACDYFVRSWAFLWDLAFVLLLNLTTFSEFPIMTLPVLANLSTVGCIGSACAFLLSFGCLLYAHFTKLQATKEMSETLVAIRWEIMGRLTRIAWLDVVMHVSVLLAYTALYKGPLVHPTPNPMVSLWPVALLSDAIYVGMMVPAWFRLGSRVHHYRAIHDPAFAPPKRD